MWVGESLPPGGREGKVPYSSPPEPPGRSRRLSDRRSQSGLREKREGENRELEREGDVGASEKFGRSQTRRLDRGRCYAHPHQFRLSGGDGRPLHLKTSQLRGHSRASPAREHLDNVVYTKAFWLRAEKRCQRCRRVFHLSFRNAAVYDRATSASFRRESPVPT